MRAGQAKRTDTFLGETIGLRGVNIMVTSGPEISPQATTEKMGSREPLQVCQTTHFCPVNIHSNTLYETVMVHQIALNCKNLK